MTPNDPRYGRPLDGPNLWPDLANFREPVEAYERAMHAFCLRLLPALALALGLPRDWFAPHFRQPTTFLRLLHYPPQPADAGRCLRLRASHPITASSPSLCQDTQGGLEVRRRDGTWLAAPPIPGTWVVNVADMLSRWTNGPLAIDAASREEPVGRGPLLVSLLLRHVDGQHRRGSADLS